MQSFLVCWMYVVSVCHIPGSAVGDSGAQQLPQISSMFSKMFCLFRE